MIIRAAVDDDESLATHLDDRTVRVVWVTATLSAIVLLLVDLSSLIGSTLSPFGALSLVVASTSALVVDACVHMNLATGYLFAIFWIYSRDGWSMRYFVATLGMVLAGNFVLAVYVIHALFDANGDWTQFWLGPRRRHRHNHAMDRSMDRNV
ncbi:Aste57867_13478 [Aphanomyces stellatus]|uniref:Aste57867_13478 protein n=1 Tax=Aphanomyces stellatus TaxID=120398 RepID=A0A485KYH3_9STRA|nr:hypothetical protein As57867_013428 [Aphanomyces stellatus]VFT90316.1 Aste57867_13478 [Aphanomyces stellatus]